PRDRALRIGGREPVRIEQPRLRAIVEARDHAQRVLGARPIDDVAAGEDGERAEAGGAAQELPPRRIGGQPGGIPDPQPWIDTGRSFAQAGHKKILSVRQSSRADFWERARQARHAPAGSPRWPPWRRNAHSAPPRSHRTGRSVPEAESASRSIDLTARRRSRPG